MQTRDHQTNSEQQDQHVIKKLVKRSTMASWLLILPAIRVLPAICALFVFVLLYLVYKPDGTKRKTS